MGWSVLYRWALRDSDTAFDRNLKVILLPVELAFGLVIMVLWTVNTSVDDGFRLLASVFWLAQCAAFLVCFGLSRVVSPVLSCKVGLWVCVVGFLGVDWLNASRLIPRLWPALVLHLDFTLVADLSLRVQVCLLGAVAAFLLLERMEAVLRFGMYEVGQQDQGVAVCSCAEPPCAIEITAGVTHYVQWLAVFLGDFFVTRSFASSTRGQIRIMQRSCEVAFTVTQALSKYEIEAAEKAVDSDAHDMPRALRSALRSLCTNLRHYRPYLPQSCMLADPDAEFGSASPFARSRADPQGSQSPVSDVIMPSPKDMSLNAAVRRRSAAAAVHASSPSTPRDLLHPTLSWASLLTGSRAATKVSMSRVSTPTPRARGKGACAQLAADIRAKRVTLLCSNRRDFLPWQDAQPAENVARLLEKSIGVFVDTVVQSKGVVDTVSGDHAFASFNAVRALGTHRTAAVQTAHDLLKSSPRRRGLPPVSVSLCSSTALCGDFGAAELKRFMAVGSVSSLLLVCDRLAARWAIDVLADHVVHSDVDVTWKCRLRAGIHHKRARGHRYPRSLLWEVLEQRQGAGGGGGGDEWMYNLAALGPNPWDAYNACMRLWTDGRKVEAAEACTKACRDEVDPVRRAGLIDLKETIDRGVPIVCVLEPLEIWPSGMLQQVYEDGTSSDTSMSLGSPRRIDSDSDGAIGAGRAPSPQLFP